VGGFGQTEMIHERAYRHQAEVQATLPLLRRMIGDLPLARRRGQTVSRRQFLADVFAVADILPAHAFAVNLCADRYAFLVAFAAVGLRGQTNLLPTSRVERVIEETRAAYVDSYFVDDSRIEARLGSALEQRRLEPMIDADHVMAIAFTSGSTGRSEPHLKRWGELVSGGLLAERRFGCLAVPGTSVVATVPPQHMYGLETTIMLPLVAGLALDAGRPFFAGDIADALALVPPPRLLVTTPAHLRVAVDAGIDWPELALVLSATAPLSRRLAGAAEKAFAAPVMEIYGFTEAGSIASRRTVDGDLWTLYDGMAIKDGCLIAAHLAEPVPIADLVEVHAGNRFALLGRHQDLVNIAGKRTSLAYLNAVLNEIEGVVDGAFVIADATGERSTRLMALVAAPGLDRTTIMAALARRIDPLFLPRPLILVDRLPRNETGKLPRDDLAALVRRAAGSAA
jgi:acyl-coenzyme A synthetase/AMP-(fatty) acid ligase